MPMYVYEKKYFIFYIILFSCIFILYNFLFKLFFVLTKLKRPYKKKNKNIIELKWEMRNTQARPICTSVPIPLQRWCSE